jgi:hypothetical protein
VSAPAVTRRVAVIAFSSLFLPRAVASCSDMPITPPDPGRLLDTLRAAQAELQALGTARPGSTLVKVALGAVDVAILAAEALVRESPPT